ncbi:MAG: hypothetical protein AAGI23_18800 [Bacteroidota bacterium]
MYRLLFVVIAFFFVTACEKETILDDCFLQEGFSKVESEDLPCNYTAVYRYEGELYAIFNCCLCNGFFPPTNCEGEALCTVDSSPDCFQDFYDRATYLYAIAED